MAQAIPTRRIVPRRVWVFLALLVLPLLLVWGAPLIVANSPLLRAAVNSATGELPFRVEVGSATLEWFSRVALYDVKLTDLEGRPLAEIGKLETDRALSQLALDRGNLGKLRIENAVGNLVFEQNSSNWEAAFLPLFVETPSGPPPQFTLELASVRLELVDAPNARKWTVDRVEGEIVSVPGEAPHGQIAWSFLPGNPASPPNGSLEFRLPETGDADTVPQPGEAKLLAAGFPLALAEPFVRRGAPSSVLTGAADADLTFRWSAERQEAEIRRLALGQFVWSDPLRFGEDTIRLTHCRALGRVVRQGERLSAENLLLETDLGHANFTGSIPLTGIDTAAAPLRLVQVLAAGDLTLSGEIDRKSVV